MRRRLASDRSWVVTVDDTGVGMAREDLAKAFEKFEQVDSGLGRAHEGTGLGLPLSRKLIQLHGGTLEATSERGVGSVFEVRLPPERTVDPDMANAARPHERDKPAVA